MRSVRQESSHAIAAVAASSYSRIVVGFDGSRSAWNALRWAADEAGRRRAALEVVTCPTGVGSGPATTEDHGARDDDSPFEQTERAAWVARCRGWQIPIIETPAGESPGDALVRRSRGAAMLVLGAHEPERPVTSAHPSLTAYCLANAPCPVTVVNSATLPEHGSIP